MRKNLLVVRAGDGSLHQHWLRHASSTRNFDLLVSYFGDQAGKYADDAEHYETAKGLKWPALYRLFQERRALLLSYEAVCFADDDLFADGDVWSQMFAIFHSYDLWLAQPALTRESCFWHPVTLAIPDAVLHYSDFVEIMCPTFNRAALAALGPTFNLSVSGHGLDFLWPHLLGYPTDRLAVIDAAQVGHFRPIRSGGHEAVCRQLAVDPNAENRDICDTYKLSQHPRSRVLGIVASHV